VESGARPTGTDSLLAGHLSLGALLRGVPAARVMCCERTADHKSMKFFALMVAVLAISANALAQVPYQRSAAPTEPRRMQMTPQGANRLQKLAPRNKIAGPAMGQRGAGIPRQGKKAPKIRAGKR
jgi:hypothetical protein